MADGMFTQGVEKLRIVLIRPLSLHLEIVLADTFLCGKASKCLPLSVCDLKYIIQLPLWYYREYQSKSTIYSTYKNLMKLSTAKHKKMIDYQTWNSYFSVMLPKKLERFGLTSR